MIDLAVELVADPFAHAGLPEQHPRPFDEVVEVGDAGRALGPRIGRGEGLARPEPCRDVRRQFRPALKPQQRADALGETLRVALIIGIGLHLARLGDAKPPLPVKTIAASSGSAAARAEGARRQPALDALDHAKPGRLAPVAVGVRDSPQQVAVEAVVGAWRGEIIVDHSGRPISCRFEVPCLRAGRVPQASRAFARRPGDTRPPPPHRAVG